MQLEIEQKFRIDDPADLSARLAAAGVIWDAQQRQVDTYFQHPSRDFRQTDEAFRIRQAGNDNFVTYKGPKIDTTTKTRQEIEVPLATGPDAAERFAEILAALGFHPSGLVAKTRRSGRLALRGCEIEIAWDEVDALGIYLELELLADETELEIGRQRIQQLAHQLGLMHSERRSYLELLLRESAGAD